LIERELHRDFSVPSAFENFGMTSLDHSASERAACSYDRLPYMKRLLVERADRLVRSIDVIEDSESRRGHGPGSIQ
jgi:hypothetical protein